MLSPAQRQMIRRRRYWLSLQQHLVNERHKRRLESHSSKAATTTTTTASTAAVTAVLVVEEEETKIHDEDDFEKIPLTPDDIRDEEEKEGNCPHHGFASDDKKEQAEEAEDDPSTTTTTSWVPFVPLSSALHMTTTAPPRKSLPPLDADEEEKKEEEDSSFEYPLEGGGSLFKNDVHPMMMSTPRDELMVLSEEAKVPPPIREEEPPPAANEERDSLPLSQGTTNSLPSFEPDSAPFCSSAALLPASSSSPSKNEGWFSLSKFLPSPPWQLTTATTATASVEEEEEESSLPFETAASSSTSVQPNNSMISSSSSFFENVDVSLLPSALQPILETLAKHSAVVIVGGLPPDLGSHRHNKKKKGKSNKRTPPSYDQLRVGQVQQSLHRLQEWVVAVSPLTTTSTGAATTNLPLLLHPIPMSTTSASSSTRPLALLLVHHVMLAQQRYRFDATIQIRGYQVLVHLVMAIAQWIRQAKEPPLEDGSQEQDNVDNVDNQKIISVARNVLRSTTQRVLVVVRRTLEVELAHNPFVQQVGWTLLLTVVDEWKNQSVAPPSTKEVEDAPFLLRLRSILGLVNSEGLVGVAATTLKRHATSCGVQRAAWAFLLLVTEIQDLQDRQDAISKKKSKKSNPSLFSTTIVQARLLPAMVTALETYPFEAGLVQSCWGVLVSWASTFGPSKHSQATNTALFPWISDGGVVERLERLLGASLRHHLQHAGAQTLALRALAKLAPHPAFEVDTVNAGASVHDSPEKSFSALSSLPKIEKEETHETSKPTFFSLIHTAMQIHPGDADVQQAGCEAWGVLIAVLISTLGPQPTAELKEATTPILTNCENSTSESMTLIGDTEVFLQVALEGLPIVLTAMKLHRLDAGVQQTACGTLRILLRAADTHQRISITSASYAADDDADDDGWCHVTPSVRNIPSAIVHSKNGISSIVAAMETHPFHAGLQRNASVVLGLVARSATRPCDHASDSSGTINQDSEYKRAIAAANGIQALVTAMESHPDDVVLQKQCCGSLRILLGGSLENKATLVLHSTGVSAVVRAMELYPSDVVLQYAACEILRVTTECQSTTMRAEGDAQNTTLDTIIVPSVEADVANAAASTPRIIAALVGVLQAHPLDSGLQVAGCRALGNIAACRPFEFSDIEHAKSTANEHTKAVDVVMTALTNHPVDLLDTGMEALGHWARSSSRIQLHILVEGGHAWLQQALKPRTPMKDVQGGENQSQPSSPRSTHTIIRPLRRAEDTYAG